MPSVARRESCSSWDISGSRSLSCSSLYRLPLVLKKRLRGNPLRVCQRCNSSKVGRCSTIWRSSIGILCSFSHALAFLQVDQVGYSKNRMRIAFLLSQSRDLLVFPFRNLDVKGSHSTHPQNFYHLDSMASTASMTAARRPPRSSAATPTMVVPPGEQTASFMAPGCCPVASWSLPVPATIWLTSR